MTEDALSGGINSGAIFANTSAPKRAHSTRLAWERGTEEEWNGSWRRNVKPGRQRIVAFSWAPSKHLFPLYQVAGAAKYTVWGA